MPRGTKFKPEEIIAKLREAEVELARVKKVPEAAKQIGVTEQTYYRWKKEYGGLRMDQAKRLKELEKENSRLKRLLSAARSSTSRSGTCGVKAESISGSIRLTSEWMLQALHMSLHSHKQAFGVLETDVQKRVIGRAQA